MVNSLKYLRSSILGCKYYKIGVCGKAFISLKMPTMDIEIRCSGLYWNHAKVSIPVHLRNNIIIF